MTDNNSHWIELTKAPSQGVTVVQTLSGCEFMPSISSNLSNDAVGQSSLNAMYGQFNLGLHVGDDSMQVHQNRAHLLQSLQHYHPALTAFIGLSKFMVMTFIRLPIKLAQQRYVLMRILLVCLMLP